MAAPVTHKTADLESYAKELDHPGISTNFKDTLNYAYLRFPDGKTTTVTYGNDAKVGHLKHMVAAKEKCKAAHLSVIYKESNTFVKLDNDVVISTRVECPKELVLHLGLVSGV